MLEAKAGEEQTHDFGGSMLIERHLRCAGNVSRMRHINLKT
jgi:hypothetical protein